MSVINAASQLCGDLSREYSYWRTKAVNAILFLTYRCTSRCKTCNIWKWSRVRIQELGWKEWEKVLLNMRSYGIRTIELFGGDALLRKDILYKIIEFCAARNIRTYFPTNSMLLDRKTASRLVNAGLDTVYFSLDDIGEGNDRIRGVDSTFLRVREALENIVIEKKNHTRPRIVICTTISNMNYRRFDEIIEFLENYPIDAVYPRILGEFAGEDIECSAVNGVPPAPFFMSSEGMSHRLTPYEYEEFKITAKKWRTAKTSAYINFRPFYEAGGYLVTGLGKGKIKRCLMCSTVPIVSPSGDVFPCLFFKDYLLGNLVKEDLSSIWGNDMHKNFIKSQRKRRICICRDCISRGYYPSLLETASYWVRRFI